MSSLPIHRTSPEKVAALTAILKAIPSSSAMAQRQRILEALAQSACTSSELQRFLDCYDANARLHELRHMHGHKINRTWVQQETEARELHRVGLFILEGRA